MQTAFKRVEDVTDDVDEGGEPKTKTDTSRWPIIYPVYFNSTKKWCEGRKLALSYCVADPRGLEIAEVCRACKIPYVYEDKAYSRDFLQRGRVRVMLQFDDKRYVHSTIRTRKDFMKYCAIEIPKLKSRQTRLEAEAKQAEAAAAKALQQAQSSSQASNNKKKKNKKK